MAQSLPLCPDCNAGYQPEDNYCRQCGMYVAALRNTAMVSATAAVPTRLERQRSSLPAPVKKAATAMAVGTALQITASLAGKYLARQAGKQAVAAVRSKPARTERKPAREITAAQPAAADPYPYASAVSETVVVRRVWIRRG
jgi:hypothetical protein